MALTPWGVDEGLCLFLPVLGPCNPRDVLGLGADIAAQPLTWIGQGDTADALYWGWAGLAAIDKREELVDAVDDVKAGSLDPYATFRSAYRQRRCALIQNQDRQRPAGHGG
ncbi:MlaA family lipoprotein [Siccirubricoccus phaeus]|uniref:MlaA family lipoprotein n=1 Tax=Siccirubricoccus phaeus TaxID=2595053 RepID=UPI0011F17E0D|nr:MlaA family lipoprotein [Siccirubricoccus phaeus]